MADESVNTERSRHEELRARFSSLWCPTDDPSVHSGVLLSNEIEHCVTAFKLIDPFLKSQLKPASYRLTIGDEYAVGGEAHRLTDKPGDEIDIPPFEVAVIKTYEVLNLPRFLIARWNIQVSRAYQGLLWIGGPQVDPGWQGHLFCPIYNLSDAHVRLRKRDPIAVIDFVRTTPFGKHSQEFPRPPKRIELADYAKLRSGLVTDIQNRVTGINSRMQEIDTQLAQTAADFQSRMNQGIVFVLTLLGVLTAALAVVASGNQGSAPFWSIVSIIIAVAAMGVAGVALYYSLRQRR